VNIEQQVAQSFQTQRKTQSRKPYYLAIEVAHFATEKGNPDSFRVMGRDIHTDEQVAVYSKLSASGQAKPEIGSIFRADKVEDLGEAKGVKRFNAPYFHSYNEDFFIAATIQPQAPKLSSENNMWSASVRALDHEVNCKSVSADHFNADDLPNILLPLMKPWASEKQSSITHDLAGKGLWDAPVKGLNPLVAIRIAGTPVNIFGKPPVEDANGNMRHPTDKEILEHLKTSIERNKTLVALLSEVGKFSKDQLATFSFAAIPGFTVNVGMGSLGGETQKYLSAPKMFGQTEGNRPNEITGKPNVFFGWKEGAFAHLKLSRTNRMIVVDVVPGNAGKLHKAIPLTVHELEAQKLQSPTNDTSAPNEQASRVKEPINDKVPDSKVSPQNDVGDQYPASVSPSAGDDQFPDFDPEDYEQFADDIAAMEQMGSGTSMPPPDDDFDDILNVAEARLQARRSRPTM